MKEIRKKKNQNQKVFQQQMKLIRSKDSFIFSKSKSSKLN